MDSIIHHVDAVTMDDVHEVAHEVLSPEAYSTIIFKPEEK
jgi:predicted Zn-dependent peptidase